MFRESERNKQSSSDKPFLAPSFRSIIKRTNKKISVKSLVICDNIIPHENRPFDKLLTKSFFKYIDHFIVMSKSVEKDLLFLFPDAKYIYTPHPLYDIFGKCNKKDKIRSLQIAAELSDKSTLKLLKIGLKDMDSDIVKISAKLISKFK